MTVLEAEVSFSFLSNLLAQFSVSELRTSLHLPVSDQGKVIFDLLDLPKDKDSRNTEWIRLEGATVLVFSPVYFLCFRESVFLRV